VAKGHREEPQLDCVSKERRQGRKEKKKKNWIFTRYLPCPFRFKIYTKVITTPPLPAQKNRSLDLGYHIVIFTSLTSSLSIFLSHSILDASSFPRRYMFIFLLYDIITRKRKKRKIERERERERERNMVEGVGGRVRVYEGESCSYRTGVTKEE